MLLEIGELPDSLNSIFTVDKIYVPSRGSRTGPAKAWPLSRGFEPVPLGRLERSFSKLREVQAPVICPVVLREGIAAVVWALVLRYLWLAEERVESLKVPPQ